MRWLYKHLRVYLQVYKCNLNPIFNATFEFDVPWEQIRDCALDVTVMDFDTVGRNELIGKLVLGCKSHELKCLFGFL